MRILPIYIFIFICIFLSACSSAYQELSDISFSPPDKLTKYLLNEYKLLADYEAKEMHDWNSTKLYSEKALLAANGKYLKPEKINNWDIENNYKNDLQKAYENIMNIYDSAIKTDPKNLAIAISSLDCWSEQQEESWQFKHIEKCKKKYLNAMHSIYNKLSVEKENNSKIEKNKTNNDAVSLVTKKDNKILQIIYFDFDKINISEIASEKIQKFILEYDNHIETYLVFGHTDTKGTKTYNYHLSIQRAENVKKILKMYGVDDKKIKIFGKGETELLVKTNDEMPHPANRRVEITSIN